MYPVLLVTIVYPDGGCPFNMNSRSLPNGNKIYAYSTLVVRRLICSPHIWPTGGTLDVTIMTLDGGVFEVLSTSGDTRAGGEDATHLLTEHLLRQFEKRTGLDAHGDKRAIQRLRREADRTKIHLSTQPQVKVEIEAFHEGHDLVELVTKARFEELCSALFKKTLSRVKLALADAKLGKEHVDIVRAAHLERHTPERCSKTTLVGHHRRA